MLNQRSTPIKLSQEAALKLPRWALLLLLAVFALSGLFADDLWTPRDIDSFGAAYTLVSQPFSAWLLPAAHGEVLAETGPLTSWLSAGLMRLLGSHGWGVIDNVIALRLASLFWFTLSATALWYSTFRLAIRPEAQPIAFAFGGEARPKDFARSIADCAVLLFVATFGILTRQHEAVPDTALIAISAANLFSLTYALKRPFAGSLLAGLSVALCILASTLFAGVWLLAQSLIVLSTLTSQPRTRDMALMLVIGVSAGVFALWPLAAYLMDGPAMLRWFSAWSITQMDHFGPAGLSTYLWFAKHSLWFLLPLWPLVLTGLCRWGRRLVQPFLFLPAIVIAVTALGVVFSSRQSADSVFLSCLPALTVFAAFSLLTIKRGWENTLDWFGLTIFSLATLTIWLYWFAWNTGVPPKMYQSVVHLAPTVRPVLDRGFVLAFLASIIWLTILAWRLTHRPVLIWRGPWINALGMTVVTAVGFGLFHLPTTEYRSMAPVAHSLDKLIVQAGWQSDQCVQAVRINPETIAVLQYYGGGPLDSLTRNETCPIVVVRASSSAPVSLPNYAPAAGRARSGELFYVLDQKTWASTGVNFVKK